MINSWQPLPWGISGMRWAEVFCHCLRPCNSPGLHWPLSKHWLWLSCSAPKPWQAQGNLGWSDCLAFMSRSSKQQAPTAEALHFQPKGEGIKIDEWTSRQHSSTNLFHNLPLFSLTQSSCSSGCFGFTMTAFIRCVLLVNWQGVEQGLGHLPLQGSESPLLKNPLFSWVLILKYMHLIRHGKQEHGVLPNTACGRVTHKGAETMEPLCLQLDQMKTKIGVTIYIYVYWRCHRKKAFMLPQHLPFACGNSVLNL